MPYIEKKYNFPENITVKKRTSEENLQKLINSKGELQKVTSLVMDLDKDILIINGKKIDDPVVVIAPYGRFNDYRWGKIINYIDGCCNEKLPKITISFENLSSHIFNDNNI